MTDPLEPEAPAVPTAWERFGGAPFFESLVHSFYQRIRTDAILLPMYPADDLEGAERRLRMFLEQYWGGPTTYHQERGHPMLRMRHMPFAIDGEARDHWLANMRGALDEQPMNAHDREMLWQYLVSAAFAMQNTGDADQPAPGIAITPRPS